MQKQVTDYLSKIGEKGGATTKKRYGKKHYSEIGKQGGRPKKVVEPKTKPIAKNKKKE
jgi:general stress protein YciG